MSAIKSLRNLSCAWRICEHGYETCRVDADRVTVVVEEGPATTDVSGWSLEWDVRAEGATSTYIREKVEGPGEHAISTDGPARRVYVVLRDREGGDVDLIEWEAPQPAPPWPVLRLGASRYASPPSSWPVTGAAIAPETSAVEGQALPAAEERETRRSVFIVHGHAEAKRLNVVRFLEQTATNFTVRVLSEALNPRSDRA